MAKAGGKLNQTPPRPGKRLGIKLFGGQKVVNGNIVVRQRGSEFIPGNGLKMSKDYTLYAVKDGTVNFRTLKGKKMVEVI